MPHEFRPGQPLHPARPDRVIALGAALLIVDLPGLSPGFDLPAFAEANAWAEVAVVRPPEDGIIGAWRRHAALRKLIAFDGPVDGWERSLRHELSSLGPPEPREVVEYIFSTRPDPTFSRALLAELLGLSHPGRSARHSAFKRRGPLTANAWIGLYTITRALSLPASLGLGDSAARLDIDPRTLRKHFHDVLRLDWRDARQGFGWKWAVERTLRLHGYLKNLPELPLAFATYYPVRPRRPRQLAGE